MRILTISYHLLHWQNNSPSIVTRIIWIGILCEDRSMSISIRIIDIRFGKHFTECMSCTIWPLHATSTLVIAILKHVLVLGIQGPVIALPFTTTFPRNLYEAFIQTQIVTNRVLPALLVLLEVGKTSGDEAVNFTQCCPLGWSVLCWQWGWRARKNYYFVFLK